VESRICRASAAVAGLALWLARGTAPVWAGQTGVAAGGAVAARAGQSSGGAEDRPATSHVRPLRRDRRVEALLREAPERSQTVARLLAVLERSDVVVWVELREPIPNRSGQLTMISANHGYRYLAASLDSRNVGDDLVAWLGHELMHAVEVAGAPDVQDAGSMKRFFARIACSTDAAGGFETTAAVDAGRAVRAEVWHAASVRSEPVRRR
jgi:hypothetical protein